MDPRRDGKEHCKAITLWSGKIVEIDIHAHEDKGNTVEENDENVETRVQNKKNNAETMGNTGRSSKSLVNNAPMKVKEPLIEEKPNVPYPQRMRRRQLDQHFGKCMEIFKKLHISIPFAKALEQMLGYVKFMKDILS